MSRQPGPGERAIEVGQWQAHLHQCHKENEMSTQDEFEDRLTDYWFEHYRSYGDMCSLCGQGGIIHTEGIRTPAGIEVGRANYCICPNGRAMRKRGWKITSPAVTEAQP